MGGTPRGEASGERREGGGRRRVEFRRGCDDRYAMTHDALVVLVVLVRVG